MVDSWADGGGRDGLGSCGPDPQRQRVALVVIVQIHGPCQGMVGDTAATQTRCILDPLGQKFLWPPLVVEQDF